MKKGLCMFYTGSFFERSTNGKENEEYFDPSKVIVRSISKEVAKDIIINNHYSHCHNKIYKYKIKTNTKISFSSNVYLFNTMNNTKIEIYLESRFCFSFGFFFKRLKSKIPDK